jgi:hypothetical protein
VFATTYNSILPADSLAKHYISRMFAELFHDWRLPFIASAVAPQR